MDHFYYRQDTYNIRIYTSNQERWEDCRHKFKLAYQQRSYKT